MCLQETKNKSMLSYTCKANSRNDVGNVKSFGDKIIALNFVV